MPAAPRPAAVSTSFWRGRLVLWQPPRGGGYRFSIDAVLLAGFCPPARRVLDLGAGCGVIGLMLLAAGAAGRVVALERLAQMAELARANARANGLAGRMHVVEGDLRTRELGRFDLVVFNPPYFAAATGSASKEHGRDAARHERAGTLADFVARSAASVAAHGAVAAVVPVARAAELTQLMAQRFLWPTRRVEVVPRRGQPPSLVLALFGRRPGRARARRPWILHPEVGPERFTPAVRQWVELGHTPPAPRPPRSARGRARASCGTQPSAQPAPSPLSSSGAPPR